MDRLKQLVSFEKVYAPFDGVVTARNTDIGQLIDSGAAGGQARALFQMAAINRLRVFISVPQIYSQAATPGLKADLTFGEFPGRRFQGTLVRTSRSIDPTARTLNVEVDVNNAKGELLPGAYTEVHLKLKEGTPTMTIPVSALLFRKEGLTGCYGERATTRRSWYLSLWAAISATSPRLQPGLRDRNGSSPIRPIPSLTENASTSRCKKSRYRGQIKAASNEAEDRSTQQRY